MDDLQTLEDQLWALTIAQETALDCASKMALTSKLDRTAQVAWDRYLRIADLKAKAEHAYMVARGMLPAR